MPILSAALLADDFGGGTNTTSTTGRDTAYSPSGITVEFLPGGGNPMPFHTIPAAASNVLWVHFRMRTAGFFDNNNSDGHVFTAYDAGGNQVCRLDVLDGDIRAQANGDTTVNGGQIVLSNNRLYTFDLRIDVTGGNIQFDVFMNASVRPVTTATAANVGAKTIPVDLTWDNFDLDVNTGQFGFYNEFIMTDGEDTRGWRLATLEPNTNGNYNEWTGDVTELADLDSATLIQGDADGERQSWNPSAYGGAASSAIRAVALKGRATRAPTGISQVTNFLRISATDYFGTAVAPPPGGQAEFFDVWDVNPDTTQPWSTTDLGTFEGGVRANT